MFLLTILISNREAFAILEFRSSNVEGFQYIYDPLHDDDDISPTVYFHPLLSSSNREGSAIKPAVI